MNIRRGICVPDEVISAQQHNTHSSSPLLQLLSETERPSSADRLLRLQPRRNTSSSSRSRVKMDNNYEPYVRILVQPQSRALRFRYKCEGRYPGALTGIGTTNEIKTYPQIKVN